jgi:hypothetical protein
MMTIKEQINENIEFLNDQQLLELVDFTTFLKVRSKIQNSKLKSASFFTEFSNEDLSLAEYGMADYYAGLLKEDKL